MDLIKGRNLHDEMEILKVDLYYSILVKKLTTRVSYYKDYNDSIVERIKFTALKWGKLNQKFLRFCIVISSQTILCLLR